MVVGFVVVASGRGEGARTGDVRGIFRPPARPPGRPSGRPSARLTHDADFEITKLSGTCASIVL